MGAFCVYGVSRSACKATATRKTIPRISEPIDAWAVRRNTMTEELFSTTEKRAKISPEFDAPQFCEDWIATAPDDVKFAVIMVRAPKVDKNGGVVLRGGAPVMTWAEYTPARAAATEPAWSAV